MTPEHLHAEPIDRTEPYKLGKLPYDFSVNLGNGDFVVERTFDPTTGCEVTVYQDAAGDHFKVYK
jgi:hypothetical protein